MAMILQVVQTEPTALRKINPEIPADLETIVTKAMAKEIHRRYETARALAEDLQRFVSGEPILARKASLIYVVYKRAQKHSAMVAVSMLCLLSVMALLAVFVRGRILAARERSRAACARYGGRGRGCPGTGARKRASPDRPKARPPAARSTCRCR